MSITKEEILAAIEAAQNARFARPADTYTITELAHILDISKKSATSQAEKMVSLGLATKINIKVINAAGRTIDSPAYTISIPKK